MQQPILEYLAAGHLCGFIRQQPVNMEGGGQTQTINFVMKAGTS